MARASKSKSSRQLSKSVTGAAAGAAENILGIAARVPRETDKAGKAALCLQLARMCEEAADHMARAQVVMFGGKEGGEAAISHLDAALECLNRLAAEGERHIAERDAKAKSA